MLDLTLVIAIVAFGAILASVYVLQRYQKDKTRASDKDLNTYIGKMFKGKPSAPVAKKIPKHSPRVLQKVFPFAITPKKLRCGSCGMFFTNSDRCIYCGSTLVIK